MLVSTDKGDSNDYDGSRTARALRDRRRRGLRKISVEITRGWRSRPRPSLCTYPGR